MENEAEWCGSHGKSAGPVADDGGLDGCGCGGLYGCGCRGGRMLEEHIGCRLSLGFDLRKCASHLGPVGIEFADKTTADFRVLPVYLDGVIDIGGDIGAFDGCSFGLDTVDAFVEVIECRGNGPVSGRGDVPKQMEGRAICV